MVRSTCLWMVLIYDVHIKKVGWYAVRLWKEALIEKMNHIACFEMPKEDNADFRNSHGSRVMI